MIYSVILLALPPSQANIQLCNQIVCDGDSVDGGDQEDRTRGAAGPGHAQPRHYLPPLRMSSHLGFSGNRIMAIIALA